ncbi:hypothetical protein HMF8227_02683 [Saliniradius amylolyticus]|uniref:YbaK/aminoacyl-tRNA synthetase-associated domain-containing protein n=1 Tax=Saliniradius amylolyticus TaxID=2183582 RepID=A0A2S2E641_9ALTE|nr:YbaK/EbsC family protein [Saliniradius amylolyticus]AWL13135.1 hypothetical protein HMF8227_02683 [Saliniradius amylolyticus]
MSMTPRINEYLNEHHIAYQTRSHQHSHSSVGTAITAEIDFTQVAKAVVLEDHEGRKLMAVLPTNRKINIARLRDELHRDFHLLHEQDVYKLFRDCDLGAIPPIAQAYNMDCIYDDALMDQDEIYLEAGDHETLIKMDRDSFRQLMEGAHHASFSYEYMH